MKTTWSVGDPSACNATLHIYRDWKNWSVGINLNFYNFTLSLGPIWLGGFWRSTW